MTAIQLRGAVLSPASALVTDARNVEVGANGAAMTATLILKRSDPSRRRDNDYDVLEGGKVVGRIFHLEAAAPEGRPWMWASGHGGHIERAAHGYEATREAAMAAFAKSWRR